MPAHAPLPTPTRSMELGGASVLVFEDAVSACRHAADRIAAVIDGGVGFRGKAVLGLATGGTPLPVYARLVERFEAGTLSFQHVSTYNLDEYYPIHPSDPNSYRSYMHQHLFSRVDLAPNHAHVLDGTVPEAFAQAHAAEYDRWIEADGGLDLQLLGIGRNGHIGFNEPTDLPLPTALALPTRVVELHPVTIADAARDFGSEERVIRRALTVGVAPILAAREIVILAFGPRKAEAVTGALTGPVSPRLPATLLRRSQARITWMLDPSAGRGLG